MSNETLFPGGAKVAVVSSWDDGRAYDMRLASILFQYGWKGTFFLCPEQIDQEGFLTTDEAREILAMGHEIGSHSLNHPHLETLTPEECARQAMESRRRLEQMFDTPVASFGYPYGFGHGEAWVADAVRAAGYASARTTEEADLLASGITDWMRLPVTAHILHDHMGLREKWEAIEESGEGIFSLWGHSHDCGDDEDKWAELECNLAWFCGHMDVWYCTQGELAAHLRRG